MTGPENYAAAQWCATVAEDATYGSDEEQFHQRQAAVHAALADIALRVAIARGADLSAWVDVTA